ncbi:hypothetical protein BV210_05955 [Halorientalis sp. IM1011]|nr:hypothetical protein BV210_05955 [Halorientalis sp. IM1011]
MQHVHYFDQHPRLSLVVLGASTILIGYLLDGELFHGYSLSITAVLLHGGVFALLLAGTMTLCGRTALPPDLCGVVSALLAFAVLYPLAVGFIWYNLVVMPPPSYGGDPTLVSMACNRLAFLLGLAPITAGVVAGAYLATPRDKRLLRVPLLAVLLVIGGPTMGYWVAVQDGAHSGFAILVYLLLAVGAGLGTLPLALFAKLEYDTFNDEQES